MIQIRGRLTKLRCLATESTAQVTSHGCTSLILSKDLFSPEPPVIAVPQPLVQNPPILGGNNAIVAGQNVQIHANNSLWIDVNMDEMGNPTATFSWSLPGGETVNAGETSGRFQVHNNGTLAITNIGLGDEGDYEVTASNSAGSDRITSTVTVLSRTLWGGFLFIFAKLPFCIAGYRCASNLFFNCSLVYGLSSL